MPGPGVREKVGLLRFLAAPALSAAALAVIVYAYDVRELEAVASRLQPVPIAIAFGLLFLNLALNCLRFHLLIRQFALVQPFISSCRMNLLSLLSGRLLAFFGQSVSRAIDLRHAGLPASLGLVTTGIESAVSLGLLGLFAVAGTLVLFGGITLAGPEASSLAISVFGIILTSAMAFGVALHPRRRRLLSAVMRRNLLRPASRIVLVTAAMQAAMLGAYLVIGRSLLPDVELVRLAAVFAIVMFCAAIPVSFAGWGVRELSAAFTFGAIGLVPGAGIAVGLSIGVLALLVLGIAIAAALVLTPPGRGVIPAVATRRPDLSRITGFLAWLIPCAVGVLILFQVRFPTESGAVNVNLADPFAMLGVFVVAIVALERGRWRVRVAVPGLLPAILFASVVLVAGFLHGFFRFGMIDWALYNRLIGWAILLCYLATGCLVVLVGGERGRSTVLRILIVSLAAIFLVELTVRFANVFVRPVLIDFGTPRFFGMQGNPNANAFQLLLVIAFVLPLSRLWAWKASAAWVDTGAKAVLIASLWMAASRAGFIALACTMIPLLAMRWLSLRQLLEIVVATLVVIVAIGLLKSGIGLLATALNGDAGQLAFIDSSFISAAETAITERIKGFLTAIEMFRERPLFGAGLGAFIHTQIQASGLPMVVHNSTLWIAAELGIVGLIAFAAIPGSVLWSLWRERGSFADRYGPSTASVVVAMAVFSSFHDVLYQRLAWFLLGLVVVATHATERAEAARNRHDG